MLIKPKFQEIRAFQYGVHPVPQWAREYCSGVVINGENYLKVNQAEHPAMLEVYYAPIGSWLVLQPSGAILRYAPQDFFSLLVSMESE